VLRSVPSALLWHHPRIFDSGPVRPEVEAPRQTGCFSPTEDRQPMTIRGLRVEVADRIWEVTAAVRRGPAWRINLQAVDDPRCRLETLADGPQAPLASELRDTLFDARFRWFVDHEGRTWRAELSPRHEAGRVDGQWIQFSLDTGVGRHRYPYDDHLVLAQMEDRKLLELLLRAIRGL
jgi:hypothetical protein